MYQAPEVEHLQRAVDAVKRQILPKKRNEPEPESDSDEHAEQSEDAESKP
jgi:hypothetical protein